MKARPTDIIVEEGKGKDSIQTNPQPLQPTPKTSTTGSTSTKAGDPLRAFMESVKTPKGKGLITPRDPSKGSRGETAENKLYNLFKSENNKEPPK